MTRSPPMQTTIACRALLAGLTLLGGCGGGGEPDPDVQQEVTRLLGDSEDDRWLALSNLQDLGPDGADAVDVLTKLLVSEKDDDMAAEIAKTLGRIGPAAAPAVPALTTLLGRKAMWPRYAAVEALGRVGPAAAPALPAVLKLTKDPDGEVAAAAREAARRLNRSRPKK